MPSQPDPTPSSGDGPSQVMTQHGLDRKTAMELVHRAMVEHDPRALAELQGYRNQNMKQKGRGRPLMRALRSGMHYKVALVASLYWNYHMWMQLQSTTQM